jgi:hypothetical protein
MLKQRKLTRELSNCGNRLLNKEIKAQYRGSWPERIPYVLQGEESKTN